MLIPQQLDPILLDSNCYDHRRRVALVCGRRAVQEPRNYENTT